MAVKTYVVTDAAGPWVAGQRVNPGDVLRLLEDDASYEVARGQLREAGAAKAAEALAQTAKTETPASKPRRARNGVA